LIAYIFGDQNGSQRKEACASKEVIKAKRKSSGGAMSDTPSSHPDHRSLWAILFAGLGLFGLSNLRNTPSGSLSSDERPLAALSPVAASAEKESNPNRALLPLETFVSSESQSSVEMGPKAHGGTAVQSGNLPAGSKSDTSADQWHLETMIVCVPNPVESAVGYCFDPVIESLQTAMSSEGFVLDRYYLPWHDYRIRVAARPTLRVDRDIRNAYLNSPGSLLFRKVETASGREKRLVLMLLVGESPLWGISKGAFTKSVEWIRASFAGLSQNKAARLHYIPPAKVRILGPFFSGSADSLAMAISETSHSEANKDLCGFLVVSGSALNVDKRQFERRASSDGKTVAFHSTQGSTDLLRFELIRYLWDNQLTSRPLEVAWLTESNTAFGLAEQLERPTGQTDTKLPAMANITAFPFPMHISRVRGILNAASESVRKDFPDLSPSWNRIRIPFEERELIRDVVPDFAPGMTAPTAELILKQIMSAISRRRFPYVGITATDARDAIFLGGLVRQHCPDAQLLIIQSDLLFTHPESRSDLKGALIGSTYPLSDFGRWGPEEPHSASAGQDRRLQFSSDYCQGTFNAAIILRGYEDLDANLDGIGHCGSSEKSKPTPVRDLRGYSFTYDQDDRQQCNCDRNALAPHAKIRQPGLWVTVVGNDGLWPLRCTSIWESATALFQADNWSTCAPWECIRRPPEIGALDPLSKEAKVAAMFDYTFSAVGAACPAEENADPRLQNIPSLRTHLDPLNRTLFFLVLFVGVNQIFKNARRKTFWAHLTFHKRRRAPYLGIEIAAMLLTSSFVTWFMTIHLGDLSSGSDTLVGPWWMRLFVVAVFEILGIAWVTEIERRGVAKTEKDEADRRKFNTSLGWIGAAVAITCVAACFVATRQFLIYVDVSLFILASIVNAGLMRIAIIASAGALLEAIKRRDAKRAVARDGRKPQEGHDPRAVVLAPDVPAPPDTRARRDPGTSPTASAERLQIKRWLAAVEPPIWIVFGHVANALRHVIVSFAPSDDAESPKQEQESGRRWVGALNLLAKSPNALALVVAIVPSVVALLMEHLLPVSMIVWNHLFFERAAHVLSGVSVWTACLLLSSCFFLFAHVRGQALLLVQDELQKVPVPWPSIKQSDGLNNKWMEQLVNSISKRHEDIRDLLWRPYATLWRKHRSTTIVLHGLILLWFAMLRTKVDPGIYDHWASVGFEILLATFFFIWVFWLYSLVCLLKACESLFDQMTVFPITRSFERLPRTLSSVFGRVMFRVRKIRPDDLRVPARYVSALEATAGTLKADDPDGQATGIHKLITGCRRANDWDQELSVGLSEEKGVDIVDRAHKALTALNNVAQALWLEIMVNIWQNRDPKLAYESSRGFVEKESSESTRARSGPTRTDPEIVDLADDFIAIQLVLSCNPLVRYAWSAFFVVTISAFLFLLAVASYSAQPQGFFATTSVAMIGTLGVLTGLVVWRIERNELLSRVSGTTPGQITFDLSFIIQATLALLLPVIALITYAFPGAFDWLESVVSPILRVTR
jgi:hypothetical protein